MTLSDAQAKAILADRKKWPLRTNKWPIPAYKGFWIKAAPGNSPQPFLHPAGALALTTHPDGLYVYAHPQASFADVVVIEVCCNNQNFNDKRSRYTSTSGNVQITLPLTWLESKITIQQGRPKAIWDASGWFASKPTSDIVLTLRHLRCLFSLTDNDYSKFGKNHLPAAHEYLCRHKDIGQITHQDMQSFVKSMALMTHFRVRP